jgi:hypothetical protein
MGWSGPAQDAVIGFRNCRAQLLGLLGTRLPIPLFLKGRQSPE